jgi:hypothetical protein
MMVVMRKGWISVSRRNESKNLIMMFMECKILYLWLLHFWSPGFSVWCAAKEENCTVFSWKIS